MKNLFLFLFSVTFLISCKKEVNTNDIIPESIQNNVTYGPHARNVMDIYLPKNRSTAATKTLIIIHGGAWMAGDKSDMNVYLNGLRQRMPDYAFFNINYRLATINGDFFPAQENDVKTAINFIVSGAENYKINTAKLSIMGASAGAHLAMLQAYKIQQPKINAVVNVFGPTNMADLHDYYSGTNQQAFQLLLGGTPSSNPTMYAQSSPINFVTAQSPPTISFHGTADIVVPISHSINLHQALQAAGVHNQFVVYQNAEHGWGGAILTDNLNKIASFLNQHVQ